MKRLFNDDWEFCEMPLGKEPEDSEYSPVDIPHDWQIWHVKDLYRTSDGWYRKKFTAEKTAGRVYSLRFDGVYMDSEIYLNGEKVYEWKYGYTAFDVPLSLKEGENEIKVRVRYQNPNTRWYSGAGIFRNVWLYETGKNRLKPDGTYVVSYPEGESWTTEIDTELISDTDCTIRHTLFNAAGEKVAVCKTIVPVGNEKISQSFDVVKPHLWDVDDPYLYSLLTEMTVGDETVDSRYEKIGFKSCRFDKDKGLFLNGRSIKLNGVCMHHDLGCLGSAYYKEASRSQLLKLKEMGVNAIRTSHNPPAEEFMELCDEMGFLVDSEILDMWQDRKTDYDYARFFDDWHERDVRSWIRRDRNRVSVLMWSIGNEIGDTNAIPRGAELTRELIRCVRIDDYKNSRPVTIGSNHMRWKGAQDCAEELGTIGYNYLESIYDEHHKAHPDWIIYGSETASTIQSRGVYHFPASVFATTYDDIQCSSLMNCATGWGAPSVEYNITEDRNRKFSLGQFIWTGWDYIGEPTPYRTKNSYFGHIDTAGFPKDSFYAYKAEWNYAAKPFVHLFPNWDYNEGQIIDIFAYSNCEEVEVFVNGESLGRQKYNHRDGHTLTGRWQAKYHKGEITAVGYDEYGKKVCSDVRRTPGEAAKLLINPERTSMLANGVDIVRFYVKAADAEMNPVDNARNRINVTVSGPGRLMGMDNGDSTDYEEYKTNSRRMFNGCLSFMVASTDEPGEITVKVSSPGLSDETVTVMSKSAKVQEGVSFRQKVCTAENKSDISVRKLELTVADQILTPSNTPCEAHIRILPENADHSYDEVFFKAVTDSGIETNLLDAEPLSDGGVRLIPRGDGKYRLRAYCKNGSYFEQVISDIEMENTGFGPASFDPYSEILPASLCTNSSQLQTDMGGGVRIRECKNVIFNNVDFGKIGSDELTVGIYTYNENKILVDLYVDGEMLCTVEFQDKNEWNTYKYNTFKLPKVLSGVKNIEFRFHEDLRFKGFRFSYPRRAGVEIMALLNDALYGDSFELGSEMIEKIGNNVTVSFENVDFGDGVTSVEITGRTRNEKDTIRLSVTDCDDISLEFSHSDGVITVKYEIEKISGLKNLTAVFLPGTDFDFKSIKFLKG